jgi:two-component system, LytTR family, response regulator
MKELQIKESPIKVLIVDDEPLARRRIRSMLGDYAEMQVIGECSNGVEALAAISRMKPDLVFLDIQMPEMDGLELISKIKENTTPLFILVTAYSQHGLTAFDLEAVDYLLKPFDHGRFEKAVNFAKSRLVSIRQQEQQANLLNLINQLESEVKYLKQIAIRSEGRIFLVKTEDIAWIEAERNYVRLHVGENSYLRREAIGNLELQLDPQIFRRIHRSAIVNLNLIKELQISPGGEYRVVLNSGESLILSQTYQKNLSEFLS